jgi:hypothetical protein
VVRLRKPRADLRWLAVLRQSADIQFLEDVEYVI